MKSSSVMLAREFYGNARAAAFLGIGALLVMIAIHAVFGFGVAPSPLLASVCVGFVGLVLTATTPRSHHLNLPLNASHLCGVLVANSWLVGVVSIAIVLTSIGIVFDRQWDGLTLAMWLTSVCLILVPLARLIAGQSAEMAGAFAACMVGSSVALAPLHEHKFLVGVSSIAMTAIGWRLSVAAVNRERLGAPTLAAIIQKWELSLSKKRGEYRCRFSGPEQALFQLDWMRLRVGLIGIPVALVIGFGLVPLLIDPSVFVLPLVAPLMSALAVLTTSSFMEADWKVNGAFRWTLPVSDESITRALRKDVAVTLLMIVLGCYFASVLILLFLYATDQLSLSVTSKSSLLSKGIANLVLLYTLTLPAQFAIGWVSAMLGLETSLLGQGLTRRQFLLSCAWCLGLYVTVKYVPSSSQPMAFGLLMAWAGVALLTRTVQAFRWARIIKVIPDGLFSQAIAMWSVGSITCVGLLVYFGFTNIGLLVLSVGLLSTIFQPAAALPIAVYLRRHFC